MTSMYLRNHNFGVVVVPVYNEVSRFSELYWNTLLNVKNVDYIFVDDASNDGTDKFLKKLENSYKNIKYLRNQVNLGKANSLKVGFDYVINNYDYFTFVGYLDFDSSFDPKEIELCLSNILLKNDPDIEIYWFSRILVYGNNINRKMYRHYISRILITYFGFLNKRIPYDTQLGFKVFKNKELINKISKYNFQTEWFIDLEILVLGNLLGASTSAMIEVPIKSWKDVNTSNYSINKIFSLLKEIIIISRLLKSFS